MMGFHVLSFPSYDEAKCEALKHPDINWQQLSEYHKDNYLSLRNMISDLIAHTKIAVDFVPNLLTPDQIKNKMFDRVIKGQYGQNNSFRLVNDMNDIINFAIINPWSSNLKEMEQFLIRESRLEIIRKIEKNKITHLIGKTDIGTTYEIVLMPSVIYNWYKWKCVNMGNMNMGNISMDIIAKNLSNAIKTQEEIDKTIPIR